MNYILPSFFKNYLYLMQILQLQTLHQIMQMHIHIYSLETIYNL